MVLAVAHPWTSAPSYLSSQSLTSCRAQVELDFFFALGTSRRRNNKLVPIKLFFLPGRRRVNSLYSEIG